MAAFREAFSDRTGVVLYIKSTNAERHAAEAEALRIAVRGCANIVIRDAYLTSEDYFSMLDACDCYVSLHRSEGFGLTVAEAMAFGKPVISTAYSSTLEFADESNSFPVPARIVEVGDDAPPYSSHSRWAEPDIAVAAEQMKRVFADRGAAASIGARARADMEMLHSPSARGPMLRRLLDEHRRTRDTFSERADTETTAFARAADMTTEPVQPLSTEPNGLFEAEAMAVESLLGSPRPNLPSRMQRLMTPLRRLVLRCIRVYWVQQLAIDRALFAALLTLRRESRSETASNAAMLQQYGSAREQTVADTARVREELTELAADVRTLRERIDAIVSLTPPKVRAKGRPDAAARHHPAKTDNQQNIERRDG